VSNNTLCLDPGQVRLYAPDGGPLILQHDAAPSCSPTPAAEASQEPLTDHQAYVVGLEASRHGIDLAAVVYDAIGCWPGTTRQISEAIASACLGWCVDQWHQDGRAES
jgi:hypothetical protein